MRAAPWIISLIATVASLNQVRAQCDAPLTRLPRGQVDVSRARAVGINPPTSKSGGQLRLSGIRVGNQLFVADVLWSRNGNKGKVVRGSVTPSQPPRISNLRSTAVVRGDSANCGSEFPDRVQLAFDYRDCNGDVLGGRVAADYVIMTRDGAGPIFGGVVCDFFGAGDRACTLTSATGTSGTASLRTCWENVAHLEFSLRLKDAGENLAAETLSVPADIP